MQGRAFVCGGEPLAALVRRTEVFLLDMDGTVYVGDQPIGAMAETLASIRASGRRIVYCTNNSSRSAQSYAQKLRALGLFDARDAVFTSGMAAIALLKERFAGARVYLVGTEALKAEFSAAGIPLAVSDADADVAVLGYDTTLTYEKLVCINRIQTANGSPITIAKNYIAASLVPDLTHTKEKIISWYAYLSERYGIVITGAKDMISACTASLLLSPSCPSCTKAAWNTAATCLPAAPCTTSGPAWSGAALLPTRTPWPP